MRQSIPVAALTLLLLEACSPFGPCYLDRIHVAFSATVTLGDAVQDWDLRGEVTTGNVGGPTYDQLVEALIEDAGSAAGVVWTLDVGLGAEAGFLAVQLAADPAEGDVLTVSGAFDGGGWGFLSAPTPGPRLAARIGAFTATSASGTLTVLETEPLRLSADVVVADGQGTSYRFAGQMVFSRTVEPVPCD